MASPYWGRDILVFFNSIFRERALLRRQRQEPLDDRVQITAPHEWMLVGGLGVMLAALLVYGVVGSVERGLSLDAVLVHPGERHAVIAPVTGAVVEILAEAGETVERGQAIARVRTPADEQWESATLRLTELLRERAGQEDGASAELLRLLLAATIVETGGTLAAGGDVISPVAGEVMTLDLAPGRPVTAGASVALIRTASSGPLEALALAPSDEAERLEVGMVAQVRLADDGRQAGVFEGRVTDISERPVHLPEWLTEYGLFTLEESHLLRVSLVENGPGPEVADGAGGSVRVVLGRSSFVGLLAPWNQK